MVVCQHLIYSMIYVFCFISSNLNFAASLILFRLLLTYLHLTVVRPTAFFDMLLMNLRINCLIYYFLHPFSKVLVFVMVFSVDLNFHTLQIKITVLQFQVFDRYYFQAFITLSAFKQIYQFTANLFLTFYPLSFSFFNLSFIIFINLQPSQIFHMKYLLNLLLIIFSLLISFLILLFKAKIINHHLKLFFLPF